MADVFTGHAGAVRLYFEGLRALDAKAAERIEAEFLESLRSPDGINILETLAKTITHFQPPLGVDDRALREIHGQRHLVAELRQMVAHGIRRRTDDRTGD